MTANLSRWSNSTTVESAWGPCSGGRRSLCESRRRVFAWAVGADVADVTTILVTSEASSNESQLRTLANQRSRWLPGARRSAMRRVRVPGATTRPSPAHVSLLSCGSLRIQPPAATESRPVGPHRWLDHLAAAIRERVVTTLLRNLMSRARPILPEPLLWQQGTEENGLSTTKPVRELEPGVSLTAG